MHCAPVRNENRAHAYVKRGKRMSDESLRRISAIARNAIQEIDCIANRLTNNSSSVTTSGLPAARTNSAGRGQNQNAFVETYTNMNYKFPSNEFVSRIKVPERIRRRYTIFSAVNH